MIKHISRYLIALICGVSTLCGQGAESNIVNELTPYTTRQTKSPDAFSFVDDQTYASLSADGRTIDCYDIRSGNKTETLFDIANTREAQIGTIEGFKLSPDKSKILVWRDSKAVYRRSSTAEYYVYEIRTRILRPVSDDFKRVQTPVFSNDARMIAFVHENNIYLKKLDFKTQVAVTSDGEVGKVLNGITDWTYEEEFSTVSMMCFSPDNNLLCYVKSNETDVPVYNLPIYGGACEPNEKYELYPGEFSYKYPVAGKPNSKVSVHTYEISNRKTKDLTLPDRNIEYIPRIDFADTAERLLVTTLNRDQNRMEIYSVNPRTTNSVSVFVEEVKNGWILPETYENLTIEPDGFVVFSGKTGWIHLYKYSFAGSLIRTISRGEFDVTAYYGTDAQGNAYYQTASPTPMDRTVCRVDKKGIAITLGNSKGTTSATFTPGCVYAMLNFSDSETPNVYTITDNRGKTIREVVNNASLKAKFPTLAKKEFITIPTDGGLMLNAYIIKPADFNPGKQYPVIVNQYSGPGSQSVLNSWGITWENYYAANGFVIFCVDGRGTGARGTNFQYTVYRNLGHYETIDQIAGANWLKKQPWVKADAIGIYGWSYGGYETLMCLQAENTPFVAGTAVAPVTDWRFYDTVYTERYMLTPQQNFDGYKESAPLKHAERMNAKLLIMTGTADDNVHPANTFEYVSALQTRGTLFDMMVFPNKNHSIFGCKARQVVYANMFRFFKANLL